ncbi:MAG: KEOPS complex subunit Cgi121 [Candidatus Thorarchaeota archaeon]
MKKFYIRDLNLNYFAGINQIKFNYGKFIDFYSINNEKKALGKFLEIIEKVQNKYQNSLIQFFRDKFILNQEHIFTACYFTEKSFLQNLNISSKKNIEFLLYLATNRQINKSIEAFGIENADLKENRLVYCISSPMDNIDIINNELLKNLYSESTDLNLNKQSLSKINIIKEFYEISDNQINSVMRSYGFNTENSKNNLDILVSSISDLIYEKMAILQIEKTKFQENKIL